jgi:hypothetical protein
MERHQHEGRLAYGLSRQRRTIGAAPMMTDIASRPLSVNGIGIASASFGFIASL